MNRINVNALLSAAILLLALLLIAGTASAAGFQNATGVNGTSETDASVIGYSSNQSAGGYVTQIDIYTANTQTQKWQGYYGNVSGNIYLNDSTDNSMYTWVVNLTNTFVYATTNSTLPSWSSLVVADNASLDSLWNFGASSDNITNTYVPSAATPNFAGRSVANPLNVTTAAGYLDYVVAGVDVSTKTNVLWAGTIYSGMTNFKGNPADYELLVPVDPTGPDVYYFYIELL